MHDLFEAAADNDLNEVKNLVQMRRASVTATDHAGQTAAHIAANNGNSDIVKYLVSVDSSLVQMKNAWQQTILHLAVQKCTFELVKYLVDECNADIYDSNDFPTGGSALHIAAGSGRVDILKYFVEEKLVDPNLRDVAQQPPAFIAADNKHLPIIRYLVEKAEANMTLANFEGDNILYVSAEIDDVSVPRYLLDEVKVNLDINWKNRRGETVLHRAAYHHSLNILKYFVEEQHADVNIRDNEGSTALHKTAHLGSILPVEYLVKSGADIRITDNSNKTPLMVARSLEVIQFLEAATTGTRNRRNIPLQYHQSTSIPHRRIMRIATWEIEPRSANFVDDKVKYLSAQIDSLLILGSVCCRHFTGATDKNLPPQQERNIRARIDPIAVDAVKAFSNFD